MFNNKPPQMFDHPLWKESRTFTEEEALALLPRVRAYDQKAIEEMTLGYLRLALVIVGQYLALFKSRRYVDDFVSAAVEGLVEGVLSLRLPHYGKDNPKSVVSAAIHRSISSCIAANNMIRVPERTVRRRRANGVSSIPTRVHDDDLLHSRAASDTNSIEGALEQVIETDLEAEIVRLRLEGYTDVEIGEQLGYRQQTIQVIRQDLHNRLNAILPRRRPK
jgi:DNA-binding CsgD family transcriptional regulator